MRGHAPRRPARSGHYHDGVNGVDMHGLFVKCKRSVDRSLTPYHDMDGKTMNG